MEVCKRVGSHGRACNTPAVCRGEPACHLRDQRHVLPHHLRLIEDQPPPAQARQWRHRNRMRLFVPQRTRASRVAIQVHLHTRPHMPHARPMNLIALRVWHSVGQHDSTPCCMRADGEYAS
jgi:hypothetical protein